MCEYPTECIRGIANDTYVEDGLPNLLLFNRFDPSLIRTDDYNELSITWKENNEAFKVIFNQKNKKNDDFQFKYGFAFIKKKDLDVMKHNPQFEKILDYEKRATPNNKYHGNILLKKNVKKGKLNMVASALAMIAINVKPRKDIDPVL